MKKNTFTPEQLQDLRRAGLDPRYYEPVNIQSRFMLVRNMATGATTTVRRAQNPNRLGI